MSLYTQIWKITDCLGTILHHVCKSNLRAVFSCSSPLVILISRVILLIDFRLFSWGLFLFVLFSIYGVHQNLASHYSLHPLRRSYNHFEVGYFCFFFFVFCLLQTDMNKSRERKPNLSGRSEFLAKGRLRKCIREAWVGTVITKKTYFLKCPWINLKPQFTNCKGEG